MTITPAQTAIETSIRSARYSNRMLIKWSKENHQLRVEMFRDLRIHWMEQARHLSNTINARIYNSRG